VGKGGESIVEERGNGRRIARKRTTKKEENRGRKNEGYDDK
jgi:hypothetical protein